MSTVRVSICAAGILSLGSPVLAGVEDIVDVLIDARNFNDFPSSVLRIDENFPALIRVHESEFGRGRFANRHRFFFTEDLASTFVFNNQTAFDISVDVALRAGTPAGKEAGFYFDRFGEPRFIVKGDGEVAAFDGAFPFFSFGQVYTPGEAARLRVIYTPGDGFTGLVPATIEYRFNEVSSGKLEFGNLENGMIDGSVGGFYTQFSPDRANPDDFALVTFRRVRIAVPGESAVSLLVVASMCLPRRRRA